MSKDTYGKIKFAAPKGWVLDYHREWVGPNHHDYADDLDQPILRPVVTSRTDFNEGEYTLAAEFSYDVAQFIDCWLRIRKR